MRLSGYPFAALALTGIFTGSQLFGQNIISAKSGLIHYTEGDVKIGGQSSAAVAAAPNNGVFQSLAVGKELAAGEGRAEMLLGPGQFLRLNENSTVKMVSNKLDATRLEVVHGSVIAEIIDMAKNSPVTLAFGGNVIELRKDGLYRIDSDQARLRVYDGEAFASGNGQTLTVKKGKEVVLGAVYAENSFDDKVGDEFSRWAQRRAGYLATVNVSSAREVGANGETWAQNIWSFNPWYGMYTYIPNNRMFMSPFGYYYFSPDMASNDMFWPYMTGGYGFYGAGLGYGYGMGFGGGCYDPLYCGYGFGNGLGGYGSGYYGPGASGGVIGGGGSGVARPGPVRGLPVRSYPGAGSRGTGSAPVTAGLPRGAGAGPVRGTGSYGGGYSRGGYSSGSGGGFSSARSSGGGSVSSSPAMAPAPSGGGRAATK